MSTSSSDQYRTRPSIFLRLNSSDTEPRELAWSEFRQRYAPVVAGFARKLGVRAQDVDDVIQDVFLGFFSVSPTFVYDPSKGRFRGYLKTVTTRSIRARVGKLLKINTVPLDQVADDAPPLEDSWDQSWHEQILRRAMHAVRADYAAHPKTFEAFELNVIRRQAAADVAAQLGMSVNSVYKAKERISAALRAKVHQIESEED